MSECRIADIVHISFLDMIQVLINMSGTKMSGIIWNFKMLF